MSTTHLMISNPWADNNSTAEKKLFSSEKETEEEFNYRVAKIAENELRENENTRLQCLEQFRDWISKNQDIENCLIDSNFLLRFLRVKKYSIPMAQQSLLKYLNYRKRFKDWTYNMDYLDENVNALISNGYIFVSPFRDALGRRVIIYNLSKFDLNRFDNKDMSRAHFITYETILEDETNQIVGVNHVGDVKGASPAILTLYSITDFATIIRWGEQSMPMRHKEVNIINLPTSLKYVYDFGLSNVRSQKIKDRCFIHNSTSDLHNRVNKNCLPLEMGGIMPMKDMVQLWKEELAAKRDRLLQYDAMNLLSDKGIITRRNTPSQDDTGIGSLPGSFRKLEVD